MTALRVRPNIRELQGYVPGEQPRDEVLIKLNTNESPYPPSPRVIEAIRAEAGAALRLYPEPSSLPLRQQAAKTYGVPVESVIAGNGSDDLLTMIVRTFVEPGATLVGVRPDYLLYKTLVQIQGAQHRTVPAWRRELPVHELADQDAPVVLSSPCNPTGVQWPLDQVAALARRLAERGHVLVLDEAYVDFAEFSGLSLLPECPNLVVLRSFSKSFSLAGMRIGLGFASPEVIGQLLKVKDSYNLDRLAIVAGAAALEDLSWMQANAEKIKQTRRHLADALAAQGFEVLPSAANFVLCRRPGHAGAELLKNLRQKGFLARRYDVEPIRDWVRISVGTPEEIEALLKAVAETVGSTNG